MITAASFLFFIGRLFHIHSRTVLIRHHEPPLHKTVCSLNVLIHYNDFNNYSFVFFFLNIFQIIQMVCNFLKLFSKSFD